MKPFRQGEWTGVQEECGCKAIAGEFTPCAQHEPPDTTEASFKKWSERKGRFLKAAEDATFDYARGERARRIQAEFDKDETKD